MAWEEELEKQRPWVHNWMEPVDVSVVSQPEVPLYACQYCLGRVGQEGSESRPLTSLRAFQSHMLSIHGRWR